VSNLAFPWATGCSCPSVCPEQSSTGTLRHCLPLFETESVRQGLSLPPSLCRPLFSLKSGLPLTSCDPIQIGFSTLYCACSSGATKSWPACQGQATLSRSDSLGNIHTHATLRVCILSPWNIFASIKKYEVSVSTVPQHPTPPQLCLLYGSSRYTEETRGLFLLRNCVVWEELTLPRPHQ
jgi:hypothetical protein